MQPATASDTDSASWAQLREVFAREGVSLGALPAPPSCVADVHRTARWLLTRLTSGDASWTAQYLHVARALAERLDFPNDALLLASRMRLVGRALRAAMAFLDPASKADEVARAIRNAIAVCLTPEERIDEVLRARHIEEPLLGLARCYAPALLALADPQQTWLVDESRLALLAEVADGVLRDPTRFARTELESLPSLRALAPASEDAVVRCFVASISTEPALPSAALPWSNVSAYRAVLRALACMPPEDAALLNALRGFDAEARSAALGPLRHRIVSQLGRAGSRHPDPELHADLVLTKVVARAPAWRTTLQKLIDVVARNTFRDILRLSGRAREDANAMDVERAAEDSDPDLWLDVKRGIRRIQDAVELASGVRRVDWLALRGARLIGVRNLNGRQKGYVLLRARADSALAFGEDEAPASTELLEGARPSTRQTWELRARLLLTPAIMHELSALYPAEVREALANTRGDLSIEESEDA